MPQKIKHILVIRLSAMGDVAMTVPVLHSFASQYPDIKITVLSRAFFRPVFIGIPNVKFYEADLKGKHKGVLGLYRLYKELSRLKIDAVADLHNVLRTNILKFYFKFNLLKIKQINKGRKEKKALIRSENKIFKPLKNTHQRYADVFNKLGFDLKLSDSSILLKREMNSKIREYIGNSTKKWVGIAPFAAHKGKAYPLEMMKQLINTLDNSGVYKIILLGGGNKEKAMLDELTIDFENTINFTGRFSFEEELQLISNLDLMISMDSGNAHLAAMFGIKTITLWGVTHPYAGFYPFGQSEANALLADREKYPLIPTSVYGNKFPEGYEKAIESITPQMILNKIKDII